EGILRRCNAKLGDISNPVAAACPSGPLTSSVLTTGQPRPEPGPSSARPQSSLRSVAVVTSLTFVQLLLQFATQLVLAKYFGAAGEMDAYVAALALPVVVATILSGSLGYVLVPVVAERLTAGKQPDAATVASQIGLYLLAVSLVITLGVAATAGPL